MKIIGPSSADGEPSFADVIASASLNMPDSELIPSHKASFGYMAQANGGKKPKCQPFEPDSWSKPLSGSPNACFDSLF
jgi:hypothetical protein